MPANVPHAVAAPEPARMLLLMLREPKACGGHITVCRYRHSSPRRDELSSNPT